jgi:hypothetical protein
VLDNWNLGVKMVSSGEYAEGKVGDEKMVVWKSGER